MFGQYPGGEVEFQAYYFVAEFLREYMGLNRTKAVVSILVRKAARDLKHPFLHFYDPVYNILRRQEKQMVSHQKRALPVLSTSHIIR
jgi:hypothetical protein